MLINAPTIRASSLLIGVIILSTAALSQAHGHDEDKHEDHKEHHGHDMQGIGMSNTSLPVKDPSKPADTYWELESGKLMLYLHIVLMIIDWILVLPVSVMFAVAKSNLHAPTQAIFLAINVLGVLCSMIYTAQAPDLYPNNVHHKIGWLVVWILVAHTVVGVIFRRNVSETLDNSSCCQERSAFIPTALYRQVYSFDHHTRHQSCSGDSAHGGSDVNSPMRSPSFDRPSPYFKDEIEMEDVLLQTPTCSKLQSLMIQYLPRLSLSCRSSFMIELIYQFSQRILLFWCLLLVFSGIVVFSGIFTGRDIFNGLAHFIKGGIFFTYGIFVLARYCGTCADLGWSWNAMPKRNGWTARIPSTEYIESMVIFVYGMMNIWLEHLNGWGKEWTAMDFEHVAISFMFIGGGLLGLLIESSTIRRLLDNMISMPEDDETRPEQSENTVKHFNFNPVPSLVWFILGIMMGGHHQEMKLGAMIHKQWGTMLSGFAVFRCGTYALSFLNPPKSTKPTRPFTEVLGSFCLTCGGLVFMFSNKNTIHWFKSIHVDAMFTLTVFVGITALLMSWTVIVLSLKGWAVERDLTRKSTRKMSVDFA